MNTTHYPINKNCRFHLGDCPDAWQAWYDDSDWESVSLPHDWSVTLPFSREYSSGTGYPVSYTHLTLPTIRLV